MGCHLRRVRRAPHSARARADRGCRGLWAPTGAGLCVHCQRRRTDRERNCTRGSAARTAVDWSAARRSARRATTGERMRERETALVPLMLSGRAQRGPRRPARYRGSVMAMRAVGKSCVIDTAPMRETGQRIAASRASSTARRCSGSNSTRDAASSPSRWSRRRSGFPGTVIDASSLLCRPVSRRE